MSDVDADGKIEEVTYEKHNPFSLAQRLRSSLRCCCQQAQGASEEKVRYLWLYVERRDPREVNAPEPRPELQDWLNVIDEAGAGGVRYLVVSSDNHLGNFPHIWEICDWAQSTHGMTVGLHTLATALSDEEIAGIKGLDSHKTRLLLSREGFEALKPLADEGIVVRLGEPEAQEIGAPCDKPGHMVFVNSYGVLYTCGMVEGNENFRLGTIFEDTFRRILADPSLPHAVQDESLIVQHGCDGCPPLFVKSLSD